MTFKELIVQVEERKKLTNMVEVAFPEGETTIYCLDGLHRGIDSWAEKEGLLEAEVLDPNVPREKLDQYFFQKEKKRNRNTLQKVFGDHPDNKIDDDGNLFCHACPYLHWNVGDADVCIDGSHSDGLNSEFLSALAWWIKNIKK